MPWSYTDPDTTKFDDKDLPIPGIISHKFPIGLCIGVCSFIVSWLKEAS